MICNHGISFEQESIHPNRSTGIYLPKMPIYQCKIAIDFVGSLFMSHRHRENFVIVVVRFSLNQKAEIRYQLRVQFVTLCIVSRVADD